MIETFKTGKNKRNLLIAISVVFLLAAIVVVVYAVGVLKNASTYTPPTAEANAMQGTPNVKQGYAYAPIKIRDGVELGMNPELKVEQDSTVKLYLTNKAANNVLCMVKAYNKGASDELGQTGTINPGEYVENLNINATKLAEGQNDIVLQIILYQPGTFQSEGTVNLQTTITK